MVYPLPFLLLLFFFYLFILLPFYPFTFLFFYLFTLLPLKNINQAKYPVLVKLSFFVSFARFVFVLTLKQPSRVRLHPCPQCYPCATHSSKAQTNSSFFPSFPLVHSSPYIPFIPILSFANEKTSRFSCSFHTKYLTLYTL